MTRKEKIAVLDKYCGEFRGTCEYCPIRVVNADTNLCKGPDKYTDKELDRCLQAINRQAEPTPATVREKVLAAAREAVCGHRTTDYGTPEDNFGKIAQLWSTYKGTDFTAMDVAMMMALLKVARIQSGTATEDSFVDLAGYAACAAECAQREKP